MSHFEVALAEFSFMSKTVNLPLDSNTSLIINMIDGIKIANFDRDSLLNP